MGRTAVIASTVVYIVVGVIYSPDAFRSNTASLSAYLKLAHLLGFSFAFGAALWVTFFGGIIMLKNLPRHQFGNLQSKIIPAYYSMFGVCISVAVASFGYLHPWKTSSTSEKYQFGVLLSALAFNFTSLFVFAPITVQMMKQRQRLEKENNNGEEVAKINPKLEAMNKKFRLFHGLSSLTTTMSFGSLAIHSWYLASKIDH